MFEVFIVYDRDGDGHQPKSLERDNKPQVVALLQPVDGKLPADEPLPLVIYYGNINNWLWWITIHGNAKSNRNSPTEVTSINRICTE